MFGSVSASASAGLVVTLLDGDDSQRLDAVKRALFMPVGGLPWHLFCSSGARCKLTGIFTHPSIQFQAQQGW
jgi:hypothetical protein